MLKNLSILVFAFLIMGCVDNATTSVTDSSTQEESSLQETEKETAADNSEELKKTNEPVVFEPDENGFFQYDGKTWVPYNGNPYTLTILTDSTCSDCSDILPQGIQSIKSVISPAVIVKELDINTEEGSSFAEKNGAVGVPTFYASEGIESLLADSNTVVPSAQLQSALKGSGDFYEIPIEAVGLEYGKRIKKFDFLENGEEPSLGNGPIMVTEFTDYQCPYCKRLHDNNKDLIAELIDSGQITYVIKDFPLAFHLEATDSHIAANYIYDQKGAESYFAFRNDLFDTVDSWSGTGVDSSRAHFQELADKQGVSDLSLAWEDPTYLAEIEADIAEGAASGVSGTPATYIDGLTLVSGAVGPDVLRAQIEAAQASQEK